MTEAEKEQIKLRATYLNGIAVAVAIVAMIAPVMAIYQAVFTATPYLVWAKLIGSVVFLVFVWNFSTSIHERAIKHLEELSRPRPIGHPHNLPRKQFTELEILNAQEGKKQE